MRVNQLALTNSHKFCLAWNLNCDKAMRLDHLRELRATRRWFEHADAGWTPAERVRRDAFYMMEVWAYPFIAIYPKELKYAKP